MLQFYEFCSELTMRLCLSLFALCFIFSTNANAKDSLSAVDRYFQSSSQTEEVEELNPAQMLEKRMKEKRAEKEKSKDKRRAFSSQKSGLKSKKTGPSTQAAASGRRSGGLPSVASGMFIK